MGAYRAVAARCSDAVLGGLTAIVITNGLSRSVHFGPDGGIRMTVRRASVSLPIQNLQLREGEIFGKRWCVAAVREQFSSIMAPRHDACFMLPFAISAMSPGSNRLPNRGRDAGRRRHLDTRNTARASGAYCDSAPMDG